MAEPVAWTTDYDVAVVKWGLLWDEPDHGIDFEIPIRAREFPVWVTIDECSTITPYWWEKLFRPIDPAAPWRGYRG